MECCNRNRLHLKSNRNQRLLVVNTGQVLKGNLHLAKYVLIRQLTYHINGLYLYKPLDIMERCLYATLDKMIIGYITHIL